MDFRIFLTILLVILCSQNAGAQQKDSTAVADSLLMLQLQQSMQPPSPAPAAQPAQAAPRSTLSTNPDVSAIGDFRTSYSDVAKRKVDFYLNQLEVQISSVVDPYARADFMFSYSKDFVTGDMTPDLEIATLTSLSMPYQLQLTLGKFKPAFGKVNILHPHAFSFVDFPAMTENYFSPEGMYMEGASLSWLVPNPFDFYQELTLETGRVESNASLVRGDDGRLSYSGHLKNFFDVTQDATLEFGLSGLTGPNQFGYSSRLGGIDLTYKWKPVQFNVMQSFTWQNELLFLLSRITDAVTRSTHAAYSLAEYQFAQRWFVGARYDYSQFPFDDAMHDVGGTLLFRFQPTEFQILALEYRHIERNYDRSSNSITLRIIFGIGTHAAHQY